MKYYQDAEAVENYIDLHKKLAIPFTVVLSSYSTRIISKAYNLHFIKNAQSNRMFAAYHMIKKDIAGKSVQKINAQALRYFSTSPMKGDFYADTIFNIDLKAAYATILKTDGFIRPKTFAYLTSLNKIERLAAVGMLAGKKNIFDMDLFGNVIRETEIISPTKDYFFHCVKKTSWLMTQASKILGDAFLFSWVDGIYFSCGNPEEMSRAVNDFFGSYGMKTTLETLEGFHVQDRKNFYHCSYKKEGNFKFINVPKPEDKFVKKLTEHLLNKNY